MSFNVILVTDELLGYAIRRHKHNADYIFTVMPREKPSAIVKAVRRAELRRDTVLVIGSRSWDAVPLVERIAADPTRMGVAMLVASAVHAPGTPTARAMALKVHGIVPIDDIRRHYNLIDAIADEISLALRMLRLGGSYAGPVLVIPDPGAPFLAARKKARVLPLMAHGGRS